MNARDAGVLTEWMSGMVSVRALHRLICFVWIVSLFVGCNSDYDDICDRKPARDELVAKKIVSVPKGKTADDVCADQLKDYLQQESFRRFVFWVQQCISGRSEQKLSVEPCFDDLITSWGPEGALNSESQAMEVELKLAYFLKYENPTKDRFVAYLNGEEPADLPTKSAGPSVNSAEKEAKIKTYIAEPDFIEPETQKKKRKKKKKRSKRNRSQKRKKGEN